MASSSSDDSVGQLGKDSCGDLGATPGRTFKGGKAVPKAFIMNPWHSGVRISVVCGEAKTNEMDLSQSAECRPWFLQRLSTKMS